MHPRLRTWFFLGLLLLPSLPRAASGGDVLDLDDLKLLLRTERDQSEIVRLVRAAEEITIRQEDLAVLKELGAGETLLTALSEMLDAAHPRGFESVLVWLRQKKPEAEIIDWALSQPAPLALTAKQKIELGRAGASEAVILALSGRYVHPGFSLYTAGTRLFSIQYPSDWQVYEWYTSDGFKVLLSPERGVKGPNLFTTGVQIQTGTLYPGDAMERLGVFEAHRAGLPRLIRSNAAYQLSPAPGPAGQPSKFSVAGREAVLQTFDAVMKGAPCRELLVRTLAEEVTYFVECVAPRSGFAASEPAFRRMLATLRPFPGRPQVVRLPSPLAGADFLDRYRESVVNIQADFGSATGFGTGFIVREDGYILTNHHVICAKEDHGDCTDQSRMQLPRSIRVFWDSEVGPKAAGEKNRSAPAELVATIHRLSPKVDMALLKIAPGREPYRALPLSPVGIRGPTGLAKEGDPVAAIGFPLPTRFGIDRITHTSGDLSRLDYSESRIASKGRRRLDSIMTQLLINKGNSGGPLVNLATGAVIGLTTWTQIASEGETGVVGEKLGYSTSCAIDYAIQLFPQLRFYPLDRELTPDAHLELASMLLARDNLDAAGFELNLAFEGESRLTLDQRAALAYQMSIYLGKLGNDDLSTQWLEKTLQTVPDHIDALTDLAYRLPADRIDRSISLLDAVVKRAPDQTRGYIDRASFYLRAKRYEDALADLARAKERGGQTLSRVHRIEGLIEIGRGNLDAALAAYRRAAEVDPDDVDARLGIADCYVRKGNGAGALIEFSRLLADRPDDPEVESAYGRHLRGLSGREGEALDHFVRAINLWIDLEKPSPAALLRDAADLARTVPDRVGVAVDAARLLHRDWPGWRATAHGELALVWAKAGSSALARAHAVIHDRHFATPILRPELPPAPLSPADIAAMIQAGYEPLLMKEVLDESALDQPVTTELVQQLAQAGWQRWHLALLIDRYVRDQREGGVVLGSGVKVGYQGNLRLDTPESPWSLVTLTNVGRVPLWGFVGRLTYYEKSGEQTREMWHGDRELNLNFGTLDPGEKRVVALGWHPWTELAKAGVTKDRIASVSLSIVSARNATFLSQVKVVGKYTKNGSVYDFHVENESPFRVGDIMVRCDFVDEKGNALLGGTGSDFEGRAVYDVVSMSGVVLKPTEKSDQVHTTRWGDWNLLRKLGITAESATARVTVVGASLLPNE